MDINKENLDGTPSSRDFMTTAYTSLSLMRLYVVSALQFYDNQTTALYRFTLEKDMAEEMEALDLIGTALNGLLDQICLLQAEHHKVVMAEVNGRR